jgi:hypothetical protein
VADDGGSAYKNMTTFLIEKQPGFGETRPGLTIPGQIDKMGYKGVETTEMVLDGVRLPAGAILGGPAGRGRGFYQMMDGIEVGRGHQSGSRPPAHGQRRAAERFGRAQGRRGGHGQTAGVGVLRGSDPGVIPHPRRIRSRRPSSAAGCCESTGLPREVYRRQFTILGHNAGCNVGLLVMAAAVKGTRERRILVNRDERDNSRGLSRRVALGQEPGGAAAALLAACTGSGGSPAGVPGPGM